MFLNLLGGAEESGSQSYVPPDGKDDRALKEALDLLLHDLMRGINSTWHGKLQHIRLDPADLPFAL